MVYLQEMAIFHGKLLNNQIVYVVLSENIVPQDPLVNHHYVPAKFALTLGCKLKLPHYLYLVIYICYIYNIAITPIMLLVISVISQ